MSYKAIEIDKKKFVLRGNFNLASNPAKRILKAEVENDPTAFEAELQALLATEGQNTLIEEEAYKAEIKARQELERKRNPKK